MSNPLFVYPITIVLAFCSILYELLIAHTLSVLAANTVVWYSLIIGTYLAFLGIGSILCNRFFSKKNACEALFQVEILLSIFGSVSAVIVHVAHMFYGYYYVQKEYFFSVGIFFLLSFLICSIIGLLSGFELPLLIRIGNELSLNKRVTNRVLGMDYLGSLVGGITFPLFFVPYLGTVQAGFCIASINLFSALLILFVSLKNYKYLYSRFLKSVFMLMVFGTALTNIKDIEQYFLKKYYYFKSPDSLQELFLRHKDFPFVKRIRSLYQKIDFVESSVREIEVILLEAYSTKYKEEPNFPKWLNLFLDGDYQFNSNMEEVYHEYFAHIPIILNKSIPKKILVLGAGDGLLLRELLKYSGIKITHVDLDGKIIQLAKNHPDLKAMNKGSLEDPRVHTIVGDGFHFIRNTDNVYDAIYIDFPSPVNYTLSKLYSKEFYQFIKKHLKANGFVVIDAPGSAAFTTPDEKGRQRMDEASDWPIYYNTLKAAGFKTVIHYVSNLEIDNNKVESILYDIGVFSDNSTNHGAQGEKKPELTEEAKQKVVKQLLLNQRRALQQGFIFAKKLTEAPSVKYMDFGIKLHILNEKRFYLSFALPYLTPSQIDYSLVNSIMRPTLPNDSIMNVRIPILQ